MNFFEHQAHARQRSKLYVFLFVLATLAVIAAVNITVFMLSSFTTHATAHDTFSASAYPELFWWTTLFTLLGIAGASFYRITSLSGGGGKVAEDLGATLVDSSTRDPRLRQLLNVVEETAIAAGVPVPQVYILESEMGLNAFASGFTASDAAITVTRGALMHLTRDELQGVIGHEFSHIFNGDMRLNTRMIGVLFGILFVGLIGRLILRARVRGRGAAPILGFGLALVIIGYVGVFFGRMIQAGVSRSRESLADACAVQFTRNPLGLSGALKKIAALSGVLSEPRSEEVSHMLIASRFAGIGALFATHPPILERIRAIEPNFRPSEIDRIPRQPVAEPAAAAAVSAAAPMAVPFTSAQNLVASVGQVSEAGLAIAAERRAAIPAKLAELAREPSAALNLVLALVLSADASERAQQMALVRALPWLPADSAQKIEALTIDVGALESALHLPLFELSFPALRRRAPNELRDMAALVDKLVFSDGRITVFEYALARLLRLQLYEVLAPQARRTTITAPKLFALRSEVQALLSVLAREGTGDARQAQAAYDLGVRRLFQMQAPPYSISADWSALDRALIRLDLLAPPAKQELIEALVQTVMHDRTITLAEAELLRAICASLHCPLPPLAAT